LVEAYSRLRNSKKDKTIAQKMEELAKEAEIAPVNEPAKRVQALAKKENEEKDEENEGVVEEAIIKMPSWNARNTRLIEPPVWEQKPTWEQPPNQVQAPTWDQDQLPQDQKQDQVSPGYAPEQQVPQVQEQQVPQVPQVPQVQEQQEQQEDNNQMREKFRPNTPDMPPPNYHLIPKGWTTHISKKDPKKPTTYYFNQKTGMSVWNISDIPVEKQTILTAVEPEEGEGDELKTDEIKNETRKIITSE